MMRLFRVLPTLSILAALLLSTLPSPADAYPGLGGGGDDRHPTMYQGSLGGSPVCVLERLGVRYVRPGWCSSAPALEMREAPGNDGGLPQGHPPVAPGSDGASPGAVRSI
jgi:hypothetical protein